MRVEEMALLAELIILAGIESSGMVLVLGNKV
jgi:hypothetical protein